VIDQLFVEISLRHNIFGIIELEKVSGGFYARSI
jgi:hypothetical protein